MYDLWTCYISGSNASACRNSNKKTGTDWVYRAGYLLFWHRPKYLYTVMQTDGSKPLMCLPLSLAAFLCSLVCFSHRYSAGHCKPSSLLQPHFILWLCLLSPDRIFMRPFILHQSLDQFWLPEFFVWICIFQFQSSHSTVSLNHHKSEIWLIGKLISIFVLDTRWRTVDAQPRPWGHNFHIYLINRNSQRPFYWQKTVKYHQTMCNNLQASIWYLCTN